MLSHESKVKSRPPGIQMFRILALETSELTGSVAAAADGKLLAELQLDPQQRSAQSLAPAVQSLLQLVGWQPREIDLLAVTIGPGSFTGLRVGVATAKVFAYAAGAEILGISTLEAIAAAAPADISTLSTVVDAQRGEVVAQQYRRSDANWLEPVGNPALVPLEAWLLGLPPGSAVAGPVLKKWTDPLPPGVTLLDKAFWHPTAGNVARLAHRDYLAGRRDDLWNLLPVYSRPSAAEEKWKKK
jgi:tRNA threonylcarbamoyladenosine biosynthesis protein TsaB